MATGADRWPFFVISYLCVIPDADQVQLFSLLKFFYLLKDFS